LISRLFSAWFSGLSEPILLLFKHRKLLVTLIKRELFNRTSGTTIGTIWVLLQPALQVVSFWFLLDVILHVRFPGMVSFLDYFLIGMIPWLMISEVLSSSISVLKNYRPLYERSVFPIVVLPLVPIIISSLIYGIVLMITAVVLGGFSALLPSFFAILIISIWLIPFAYLLSILGLFIKDLANAMPFLLTMVLYLSPILYMPSMIPERFHVFLALNPIADLLSLLHWSIQGMDADIWNAYRLLLLWGILILPAWVLFRRVEPFIREVD